jgi:hypothetical protein
VLMKSRMLFMVLRGAQRCCGVLQGAESRECRFRAQSGLMLLWKLK